MIKCDEKSGKIEQYILEGQKIEVEPNTKSNFFEFKAAKCVYPKCCSIKYTVSKTSSIRENPDNFFSEPLEAEKGSFKTTFEAPTESERVFYIHYLNTVDDSAVVSPPITVSVNVPEVPEVIFDPMLEIEEENRRKEEKEEAERLDERQRAE